MALPTKQEAGKICRTDKKDKFCNINHPNNTEVKTKDAEDYRKSPEGSDKIRRARTKEIVLLFNFCIIRVFKNINNKKIDKRSEFFRHHGKHFLIFRGSAYSCLAVLGCRRSSVELPQTSSDFLSSLRVCFGDRWVTSAILG